MLDRRKIVVLDGILINPGDLSWESVGNLGELELHDRTETSAEVIARCHGAPIVAINKVPFPESIFRKLPELRLLVVTATGHDQVDLAAARRHGVIVCNVPGYGTDSVAEHVFALILALARRPELHDRQVRDGAWVAANTNAFWTTPQWELAGNTIGVVGWGQIGRRVGQIATAFGMRVLVTSRARSLDSVAGVEPEWVPLQDLFRRSDVVSLHCPLTSETQGLVDRKLLRQMPRHALLINTARGGLIVEADLVQALHAGWIAGAGLDVVGQEPLSASDPLLAAPHLLVTPHLAWGTRAARQRLMDATVANILAYQAGRPTNVVS